MTDTSFSFTDHVKEVLERPDMTDHEAEFILWEHTPFPLVRSPVGLAPYLAAYRAADIEEAK